MKNKIEFYYHGTYINLVVLFAWLLFTSCSQNDDSCYQVKLYDFQNRMRKAVDCDSIEIYNSHCYNSRSGFNHYFEITAVNPVIGIESSDTSDYVKLLGGESVKFIDSNNIDVTEISVVLMSRWKENEGKGHGVEYIYTQKKILIKTYPYNNSK